mgnify:CR=1 FL=1
MLADQAEALRAAGLRRLNVHLDTLDRERFRQITRRDDFHRVINGIETALRLGFSPIKINAVAVKNLVEPDDFPFTTATGSAPSVSICGLPGAVSWRSGLAVDCDGKSSTACNRSTDPYYQGQTAATDSHA